MSLPISIVPRGKVELESGEVVQLRGLSRAEALMARDINQRDGIAEMERYTIACAFEADPISTADWYATAANGDVDRISTAIARLSGLDDDKGKSDAGA